MLYFLAIQPDFTNKKRQLREVLKTYSFDVNEAEAGARPSTIANVIKAISRYR